jgi:hypothetical protein
VAVPVCALYVRMHTGAEVVQAVSAG